MNKIDLIIEKIETAKTERLERQRHKLIDDALAAARELQTLQPHPDHYAEVYIRVGDLHIKKVLTQIEYSQAYEPIKLLSLMADDCVQNLKELL